MVEVRRADGFSDWEALRALIGEAFAGMEGRIDPPSSLSRMDAEALEAKAGAETLLLAREGARLAGCLFADRREEALHLSKMAVAPARQGQGVGRALMAAAEALAREAGLPALELQTRVELEENHLTFARLGFGQVGETAHPGFSRPTSLTFRKAVGRGGLSG